MRRWDPLRESVVIAPQRHGLNFPLSTARVLTPGRFDEGFEEAWTSQEPKNSSSEALWTRQLKLSQAFWRRMDPL